MVHSLKMSEIDKIVAFNVLFWMRELELDQKSLAKKAGITAAYLNKLVKNKKPISKSPKLAAIAKALVVEEKNLYINQRERLQNLAMRLSFAVKNSLRKSGRDETFRPLITKNAEWLDDLIGVWDRIPEAIQLELTNLAFTAVGDPKYARAFEKISAENSAAIKRAEEHVRKQMEVHKEIQKNRANPKKKSVGSR